MLAEELSKKIGVPEHIRDSVIQYRMHHHESMRRLHQREAAAALFFVYSKNYLKANKSLKELCETTGADRSTTGKYLTHFILDDGLQSMYKQPEDYLSVYGSRLNIPQEIVGKSQEMARTYRETFINSITPRTIAATALYLACCGNGHKHTQKEIAQTFGIAEYTVRELSATMKRSLRL